MPRLIAYQPLWFIQCQSHLSRRVVNFIFKKFVSVIDNNLFAHSYIYLPTPPPYKQNVTQG